MAATTSASQSLLQLLAAYWPTNSSSIVATWADRFSWCCWWRFLRFLTCPLTLPPASHCLSSLLHAIAAA